LWAEPNEIDDLENTKRVDDEERDEPPSLTSARGVPECEALNNHTPDNHGDNQNNDRINDRHKEWGIVRNR